MLKELKYIFYLVVLLIFFIFVTKFYISDENKKNSFRSAKNINDKIFVYSSKLPLLQNNTKNIIFYTENIQNKNKKKYHFWDLLLKDEK